MDSLSQLSASLVAQFLENEGYTNTLQAFKSESLEPIAPVNDSNLSLKQLVEDYELSRVQHISLSDAENYTSDLQRKIQYLEVNTETLPTEVTATVRETGNVLCTALGTLPRRSWDSKTLAFRSEAVPCIIATTTDKTLKLYSQDDCSLQDSFEFPHPVLTVAVHPVDSRSRFLVAGTMGGTLVLLDLLKREVTQTLRDNAKYIVKTAWSSNGRWIATISYDKTLTVYECVEKCIEEPILLDGEVPDLFYEQDSLQLELVQCFSRQLPKTPEALAFLPSLSHLVFSARDDNMLHYLKLPSAVKTEIGKFYDTGVSQQSDWDITGYNLNPNGDHWVSFTVSHIVTHPYLPLLSLQTSTENARVLLYPFFSDKRLSTLYTTSEQSDYSTPRHFWLRDGTAFVVNSEDGVIRLVDIKGNVVRKIVHNSPTPAPTTALSGGSVSERLQSARDSVKGSGSGSTIIKDIVSYVRPNGHHVIVSGGFDKTLRWAM